MGKARGKQGEDSPPAFPLLSPCHPIAEDMPVHGLRVAEASLLTFPRTREIARVQCHCFFRLTKISAGLKTAHFIEVAI